MVLQADLTNAQGGKTDAVTARYNALRAKVAKTIASAKSAADFDDVLAELAKPADNQTNYNAANQVENLRRFARKWQEYYSQTEAGNSTAAQRILTELANDGSTDAISPRSLTLARLNGVAPKGTLPEANEPLIPPDQLTLSNLDKLLQQLSTRRVNPNSGIIDPAIDGLAQATERIQVAVEQLQLGNPQPAVSLGTDSSMAFRARAYGPKIMALQRDLTLAGIAKSIEAPPALNPEHDETVRAYIERVIEHGRETKDWGLVSRTIKTAQSIGGLRTLVGNEFVSYGHFFAAMNEEAAEEWVLAVRDYKEALHAAGPLGPTKEITERLVQLKQSHPKEYDVSGVGLGSEPAEANPPNGKR
jgi:hypothetical protein